MVGGDQAVLERVLPVLQCVGKRITHMGAVGHGQATKAVNQVIIAGIAQELPPPAEAGPESPARRILAQTARVGAMMRRISDFATARSEQPECVDVNAMLQALCDFHAIDRRFRGTPVTFSPGPALPACELVPDHLNEVMMSLLLALLDARPADAPRQALQVLTEAAERGVCIHLGVGADVASAAGLEAALAVDPRLAAVQRRVAQMGGRLVVADGQVRIELPAVSTAA